MEPVKTDTLTGIVYREWNISPSRAVILLVHGLGAHSARWSDLAEFFIHRGISCYAMELKGYGETSDIKGHVSSFGVYYRDIQRLREIISEKHPGEKVFLLGESMGGLIAFMAAAVEPGPFDGLICVSPVFASKLKFSVLDYVKMAVCALCNPARQFRMPFSSEMCTQDAACRETMDADSREHRLASARTLFETIAASIRAEWIKKRILIPVLFLLAGNDKLVSSVASKRIFKAIKTRDKNLIEYPDMYHSLTIESGRKMVFRDILMWIDRHEPQ